MNYILIIKKFHFIIFHNCEPTEVVMSHSKLQKQYVKFRKYTYKTFFILEDLIYDISKDKTLKDKDLKNVIHFLKNSRKKYYKIICEIDNFNLKTFKDKELNKKFLNNLLVLPIYEDQDLYVDINTNIGDIFNR